MFRRKLREQKPVPQTIFERPMWRFFGMIGNFFILTVYWLLASLPVVTIGASTTALFYVCSKLRRGEEGKLSSMFLKSFRENFRQATFLWLLYIFVALDLWIIGSMLGRGGLFSAADFAMGSGKYYPALVTVCLIYLAVMIYTAALLAAFKQTTGQCISAAVMMTFAQLPSTLLFLFTLWALGLMTWYLFPALIFIDVPMAVYLITMRMNVIFDRQIARMGEKKESEQAAK